MRILFIIAVAGLLTACNHKQSQTPNINPSSDTTDVSKRDSKDAKTTNATESKQTAIYQSSDKKLSSTFNQLVNQAPKLLQADIKQTQANWLKQRSQTCDVSGLNHPSNIKQEQCFIKQNSQRFTQLTRQTTMLKDLFDIQLTTLDHNNNKLEPTFEACGIDVPYIDSKKQLLNWQSICSDKKEPPRQSDKIKNMSISDSTLVIEALSKSNQSYQLKFTLEPKKLHSYKLLIKDDTKALTDMSFESHVIPNKLINVNIEKLCGDFEG